MVNVSGLGEYMLEVSVIALSTDKEEQVRVIQRIKSGELNLIRDLNTGVKLFLARNKRRVDFLVYVHTIKLNADICP